MQGKSTICAEGLGTNEGSTVVTMAMGDLYKVYGEMSFHCLEVILIESPGAHREMSTNKVRELWHTGPSQYILQHWIYLTVNDMQM